MKKTFVLFFFVFFSVSLFANNLEVKAYNEINTLEDVVNFRKSVEDKNHKVVFVTDTITINYVEISIFEDNGNNLVKYRTYRYASNDRLYLYDPIENKFRMLTVLVKIK